MIDFATAASSLALQGWPVFPIGQDKKPLTKHGVKDATKDLGQIAEWARQWPDALVGVQTGRASGVFVLDVDVKNGKDGFSTLRAKSWNLPLTRTHKTRSDGAHYLFRLTGDSLLKNSAGKLGDGLDTRGDGGYIVWWPAYGGAVQNPDVFADIPSYLVEALQESPKAREASSNKKITEGTRNDTLFRLASSLRAKGLTEEAIEVVLQIENAAKCSPLLFANEIKRIAQSVGRYSEGDTEGDDVETFGYAEGHFQVSSKGVFFIGMGKDDKPFRMWLSSELRVCAMTRDARNVEWGRLLKWRDKDGVKHQYTLALELMQGESPDSRRELARRGLAISPTRKAREMLDHYVQVWPVEARARCVDRLGWHGAIYVTPTESIGQVSEIVVFQNAHTIEPGFSESGTTNEWRDSVGRLAAGNSRLVFALSAAFAGPLADIASEDSGGFHFRGGSSSGKTTILKAAASVWGCPNAYPRLWRATANGLEGLAAVHNDGLLILDELSQIDPKEAGEAAYMLANGQGKARASRTGAARQPARWRLLFLSAGEESLSALMARVGRKSNVGQEIRLADIAADAGERMGAFETLHDQPNPAALALAVKDVASRYHGAVGQAWLRSIVENRTQLPEWIESSIKQFVQRTVPKDIAGQVSRVARRFGLVAAAGELASHYGLTGWQAGEATNAASKCFEIWLDSFGGTGNKEQRAMLDQVRAFFEVHGASRFAPLDLPPQNGDQRVLNRAGFVRINSEGVREFLVLPEVFKREVCSGFDAKTATAALIQAEWIAPGGDGRATQKPRLPGMGLARCYVFTGRMWDSE